MEINRNRPKRPERLISIPRFQGGNLMRLTVALSMLASMTLPALAAPDFSGTYLCLTDAAGGLWYNAATSKWEGASFTPNGKRLVKLVRSGSGLQQSASGKPTEITTYAVTIRDVGSTYEQKCIARHGDEVALTGDSGWLWCSIMLTDVQVNLSTGRFLSTYLAGFIEGEDNNDNTPSIQGGTCEKID